MNALTYCDNGHLWDQETGQRCHWCAEEAHEEALELIEEIKEILPEHVHWSVYEKLDMLKDILTDAGRIDDGRRSNGARDS